MLSEVKGYLPAERIKAAYPHSRIIWFDSPQLALEALSMGDVDGVLGDAVSTHYLIQTHYLLNLRIENFAPIDSQGGSTVPERSGVALSFCRRPPNA